MLKGDILSKHSMEKLLMFVKERIQKEHPLSNGITTEGRTKFGSLNLFDVD